jgi:4-amino-4-deoxy-L-arabinose transferase-like glycosyltransferase
MQLLPNTSTKLFYYWTFIVVAVLILLPLFMDGMFADALLYSSVAHNQALGKGTFWFPWFSKLSLGNTPTFHEQPPLLFYIQSLFFKAFGSSIYVDRFYVLVCLLLNYWGMYKIWTRVADTQYQSYFWLPLLCYSINPVVTWSFTNTINEVGMNVFTIWAIYFCVIAFQQSHSIISLLLAATFTICAALSKGVPGLFPIVAPFIIAVVHGTFLRRMWQSFLLLLCIAIFFTTLIYFNPTADASLKIYFYDRLLNRVNNDPTVSNRFSILFGAAGELIPNIVIGILLFVLAKKQKFTAPKISKWVYALVLIGLSGIFPLILTKVQRGFYYLCGVAPLVLGLSVLLVPYAHFVLQKLDTSLSKNKVLQYITIALGICAVVLIFVFSGKPKRDKAILHDVKALKTYCGNATELSATQTVFNDWGFQQYMMRYNSTSLDHKDTTLKYFLIGKNAQAPDSFLYRKSQVELINFDLFERK